MTTQQLPLCPLSLEGMAQNWNTREEFEALYAQGPPYVVDLGEGYHRPWLAPRCGKISPESGNPCVLPEGHPRGADHRVEDGRWFTLLPTREDLIAICERALSTPESKWSNRDSAVATKQLGEAYALLKAGCEFSIVEKDDRLNTWWVVITYKGFDYFEGTFDGMGPLDDDRFYIPFADKFEDGEDWY